MKYIWNKSVKNAIIPSIISMGYGEGCPQLKDCLQPCV